MQFYHDYHDEQHIMYEYRFNENRIERWPLGGARGSSGSYPNSAESSSPPWGESSPEFPEFLGSAAGARPRRTTSPASPKNSCSASVIVPRTTYQRRSALRQKSGGRPKMAKSVQWVSDVKKKPEEISSDRRVVKVQVKKNRNKGWCVIFATGSPACRTDFLTKPIFVGRTFAAPLHIQHLKSLETALKVLTFSQPGNEKCLRLQKMCIRWQMWGKTSRDVKDQIKSTPIPRSTFFQVLMVVW